MERSWFQESDGDTHGEQGSDDGAEYRDVRVGDEGWSWQRPISMQRS